MVIICTEHRDKVLEKILSTDVRRSFSFLPSLILGLPVPSDRSSHRDVVYHSDFAVEVPQNLAVEGVEGHH